MEFRARDYRAEDEAFALPRDPAQNHPLSSSSSSLQDDPIQYEKSEFIDPLRAPDSNVAVSLEESQDVESTSTAGLLGKATVQLPQKEWTAFKRLLMQRFSGSKMVSVSMRSDVIMRGGKGHEKSSTNLHLEELEDPQKFAEEGAKVITQQEYISRLHELKDDINRAWYGDNRVTSLKLSIQVARLLMDTSVLQFYPMLFVLVTDVMDMLGDMVFERIKQRAEFTEDGIRICSLLEKFEARDICFDAKETCTNWFCKIGCIRELLPRIYLELAILPCWAFLVNRPADCLKRLVMMTRGLADPLASAYCRLYMARCAQKLAQYDIGFLIACINDIKVQLSLIASAKETTHGNLYDNKAMLVSLIEPTIEYIMKCIFKDACQRQVGDILVDLGLGRNQVVLFGEVPCISIVLHHLLKQLPIEVVTSNAVEILQVIGCSSDSSYNQCLNYRLLGFMLCERRNQTEVINTNAVLDKIIQVISQYDCLDEYLKVVDAYVDIVLQNQIDNYLDVILDGISKRAGIKGIAEKELGSLESIFLKILTHFNCLQDAFALKHFVEILDLMYGSSRSIVNMHLLNMATRGGRISDRATIQFLFEISQSLHDGVDILNAKNDFQQQSRLISRFVQMVDYGTELEHHLTFLVECRGAFGGINELKEGIVHTSNCLAIKAMKDAKKHLSFVKSCIAVSEVTIPSISDSVIQLNLYLETAEVALLSGLVSHSDGLLESAIICLQSVDLIDGPRSLIDVDAIISTIQKLCSFFVMVPGTLEQGVTYIPKSILSLISSRPWMTPRLRTRASCAILSLSATLSQNKLPYHANNSEVPGNDLLFFGDKSYSQDLVSLSNVIIQNLFDVIQQEPSRAARGIIALEACNCIASSFKLNHEVSEICTKLMEIAKHCLSINDKFLQSTTKFLDKNSATPAVLSISVAS